MDDNRSQDDGPNEQDLFRQVLAAPILDELKCFIQERYPEIFEEISQKTDEMDIINGLFGKKPFHKLKPAYEYWKNHSPRSAFYRAVSRKFSRSYIITATSVGLFVGFFVGFVLVFFFF